MLEFQPDITEALGRFNQHLASGSAANSPYRDHSQLSADDAMKLQSLDATLLALTCAAERDESPITPEWLIECGGVDRSRNDVIYRFDFGKAYVIGMQGEVGGDWDVRRGLFLNARVNTRGELLTALRLFKASCDQWPNGKQ